MGGGLTNFSTMKTSLIKYRKFLKMDESGELEKLPGKEEASIRRQMSRMNRNFEGILNIEELPEALVIIDVKNGGVTFKDKQGNIWIEEYIIKNDPTHILNGFIWGLWGIYDYWLLTKNKGVEKLFYRYVKTIYNNINEYDIGYWSLYEIANLPINMRASTFYHKLHIVQLKVLFKMTNNTIFEDTANKWSKYLNKKFNVLRATLMKIVFKLCYY